MPTSNDRPVALRAPACDLACDASLAPQSKAWNQLAKAGAFKGHAAGAFEFNAKTFGELIANFRAQSNGRVAVDYEHTSETLEGGVAQAGAPAVAWVVELELRADGRELWGLFEWVDPQAVEYVRAGRYRYLSPAVVFNARDRVTGRPIGAALSSVALTNNPFLLHMQPLAASARAEMENETMPESQTAAQADAHASDLAAVRAERDKIAAEMAALKSAHEQLVAERAARLRTEATETVAALVAAGAIEGDAAVNAAVTLYTGARETFDALYGAKLTALRTAAPGAALAARFPGLAREATPAQPADLVRALLKSAVAPQGGAPGGEAAAEDYARMPYDAAIEKIAAKLRADNKDLSVADSYGNASAVLLRQHGRVR